MSPPTDQHFPLYYPTESTIDHLYGFNDLGPNSLCPSAQELRTALQCHLSTNNGLITLNAQMIFDQARLQWRVFSFDQTVTL